MFFWLIAAIFSYLILAVVFLVDKHLLTGKIQNPKVYAFYVGTLGILVLLFIPFTNFSVPTLPQISISFLAGAFWIIGLIWFYKALKLFETSRVVPAIGGLTPLFSLTLIYIFSKGKETLNGSDFLAFLFLILGTVLITYENSRISLKSLSISGAAAFLFSLSFVLTKYVYLSQDFLNGYIWIRIGGFLAALCLLFLSKDIKKEIFRKKINYSSFISGFSLSKTAIVFTLNQGAGVVASILQNIAFFLAPLIYVALINALQGVQYAFLLVLTLIISLKFPNIMREKISRKIISQKLLAVVFIGVGLIFLAIK